VTDSLEIPIEHIIPAFMHQVFSFLDLKEFPYLASYVSFCPNVSFRFKFFILAIRLDHNF
jgi:hypothetical protein